MVLNQYQIVLVNLDPTVGSEIKKTRPSVIISPDEMNHNLRTIVVCPLTSTSKKYPTRIEIKHNKTEGWIVVDQIRTIDKSRVVKVFDSLSSSKAKELKEVIKETFVD